MDFTKYHIFPETVEAKFSAIKNIRNKLLLESDWTQLADAPLTDANKLLWQTYREALQVIELSNANPDLIVLPDPPTFTNSQPPAEVVAYRASRADLKQQADAAIVRLQGYQTQTPPFTQAGYTALVNAIKDMAQIEEKLLKVLRRVI